MEKIIVNYAGELLYNPLTWIIGGITLSALVVWGIFSLRKIKKGNRNFKCIQKMMNLSKNASKLEAKDILTIIECAFELEKNSGIVFSSEEENPSFEKQITVLSIIDSFFTETVKEWLTTRLIETRTPNQIMALQIELSFSSYREIYEKILDEYFFERLDGNGPLADAENSESQENRLTIAKAG